MMKALLMMRAIAKSSSSGRRAAFVAPQTAKLHFSRCHGNDASVQRRRYTTTINLLRPSPYNFQRYCNFNHFSTENFEGTSPTAATAPNEQLNPFTWSDLIHLFTDPKNDYSNEKTNNYIPSDHPNLALFRRSIAAQALYEDHKTFVNNNWKSPYDYLVFSKFGKEFGFEKELIQVDFSQGNDPLVTLSEGFRYQCVPSLSEACDYTIQNGFTYLNLVLNDFPYDVEEGIQHWCLWKIGGKCRTEGILMEELQWALQELNRYPTESDGVGCSSSLIVKQNELTESVVSTIDKFSSFHWVNPPHLQSSKFVVCVYHFLLQVVCLNDDQLQYTKICSETY